MGRIAGRKAVIYMGIASSAASASLVAYQSAFSINFPTDKIEVTAFGDPGKTYVGGMPDQSGSFSGFYDDASAQTYTAAIDGLERKFYLYPSSLLTTQYFFGTIIVDQSISNEVSGAPTVSADWSAASPILKVG